MSQLSVDVSELRTKLMSVVTLPLPEPASGSLVRQIWTRLSRALPSSTEKEEKATLKATLDFRAEALGRSLVEYAPHVIDAAFRTISGSADYPDAFVPLFIRLKSQQGEADNRLTSAALFSAPERSRGVVERYQHASDRREGSFVTFVVPDGQGGLRVLKIVRTPKTSPTAAVSGLGNPGGLLEESDTDFRPGREFLEELGELCQTDAERMLLTRIVDAIRFDPLSSYPDTQHNLNRAWGWVTQAHGYLGTISAPELLQQAISLFEELVQRSVNNTGPGEVATIAFKTPEELARDATKSHYPHEVANDASALPLAAKLYGVKDPDLLGALSSSYIIDDLAHRIGVLPVDLDNHVRKVIRQSIDGNSAEPDESSHAVLSLTVAPRPTVIEPFGLRAFEDHSPALRTRLDALDVLTGEEEVDATINGKIPLMFVGAARAWSRLPQPEQAVNRAIITKLVELMDPQKAYVATGATNYGVDRVVHETARAEIGRGAQLNVVGLLAREASPEELAPYTITHATFIGDTWGDFALKTAELIEGADGLIVSFAGGPFVEQTKAYAQRFGTQVVNPASLSSTDIPALGSVDPQEQPVVHAVMESYRKQPEIFDAEKIREYLDAYGIDLPQPVRRVHADELAQRVKDQHITAYRVEQVAAAPRPFAVLPEGTPTFSFRSRDANGNLEIPRTVGPGSILILNNASAITDILVRINERLTEGRLPDTHNDPAFEADTKAVIDFFGRTANVYEFGNPGTAGEEKEGIIKANQNMLTDATAGGTLEGHPAPSGFREASRWPAPYLDTIIEGIAERANDWLGDDLTRQTATRSYITAMLNNLVLAPRKPPENQNLKAVQFDAPVVVINKNGERLNVASGTMIVLSFTGDGKTLLDARPVSRNDVEVLGTYRDVDRDDGANVINSVAVLDQHTGITARRQRRSALSIPSRLSY